MIETINYGEIEWSHIINPSDDDFRLLDEKYHFHHLDIEDCRSTTNLRPKVDIYDDYYFLNFHFPVFDKTNTHVDVKEIKVFWGKKYVITVGRSYWIVKQFFDLEKVSRNKMKINSFVLIGNN